MAICFCSLFADNMNYNPICQRHLNSHMVLRPTVLEFVRLKFLTNIICVITVMNNILRLSSNEQKLHNDRCIMFLIFYWVSEWVIVLFIAKSALLQLYQDQSNFSMRSWWGPFCTRPTSFVDFFCSASWLKQQSADRHVAPTRTHYPESEPTILCSFCLLLRA